MTPEEYKTRYQNPQEDPEKFAKESLEGAETVDEIIERMNSFSQIVTGKPTIAWIDYQGKKIFSCDNSAAEDHRFTTIGSYHLHDLFMKMPKGTKIYALFYIKKIRYNFEATIAQKRLNLAMRYHGKNFRGAIYGPTGMQKVILNFASFHKDNMLLADTQEEALEWLISK